MYLIDTNVWLELLLEQEKADNVYRLLEDVKILQKILFFESGKTDKPVVFLFHPNECITVNGGVSTERRANNFIEYLFADVLRQRLKLRNLGQKSLKLLDGVLREASEYGFEFVSVNTMRKRYLAT